MAKAFYGRRLQVAREFRGLTQLQLAEEVSASGSLISLCETGKKSEPSADLIEACAEVLGFTSSFFYEPLDDRFVEEECSFRHRRTAPEALKSQVRAHGTLMGLVIKQLRLLFRLPAINVPLIKVSGLLDVDDAADECRRYWNLSVDSPLLQVGRVVEHAGVVIVKHLVQSTTVDAFSRYGTTPVIFLNQAVRSTSRWNFDIAHECGHLVMHRGQPTGSLESEAQADRFASAFLMPRLAFGKEFPRGYFSWGHIFDLKRRWQTSAAAIIRRAHDLRILGPVEYRRACKHISASGWTKGEPHEPYFQEPELLDTALSALGTKVAYSTSDLCRDLNFTKATFREVTGFEVLSTQTRGVTVMPITTANPSGPLAVTHDENHHD